MFEWRIEGGQIEYAAEDEEEINVDELLHVEERPAPQLLDVEYSEDNVSVVDQGQGDVATVEDNDEESSASEAPSVGDLGDDRRDEDIGEIPDDTDQQVSVSDDEQDEVGEGTDDEIPEMMAHDDDSDDESDVDNVPNMEEIPAAVERISNRPGLRRNRKPVNGHRNSFAREFSYSEISGNKPMKKANIH